MNVFEYMGIKPNWFCPQEVCIVCVTGEEKKDCINCPKVSIVTELDGNLMVQAINAMQSKGEFYGLDSFLDWADTKWHELDHDDHMYEKNFELFLFGSPQKFFELMEEALKEGVIGK